MSNLFKSGIIGLGNMNSKPYVLDANLRVIEKEASGKIIRPIEENADAESESAAAEDAVSNKELLDDALDKAKDLYDDAREKANKIIQDAYAEADSIRDNARQEGYELGLEEGNMEAMKRADIYLDKLQKEQNELLAENNKKMEECILDAENKIVDVACMLIDKLTGILVKDYKPVMLHMINNALNESEAGRKFIIRVSEDNYAYISDNYERLSGAANPGISIEIYGDSKLDTHNCIIESENGIIDLSMDIQVRNLITAIKLLSE